MWKQLSRSDLLLLCHFGSILILFRKFYGEIRVNISETLTVSEKKSSEVSFPYLELLKMPFNGLVVLIKTLRTFDNH